VFGLKFNFKDLANEHGLTFDGTKTATYADMDSIAKPWSASELALAQTLVDFIYDQFIEKVAKGRKLDLDRVREIAQGRVWSGMDALKLGLVDGYGGLADAVNRAADKAGIAKDKIILKEIPDKRTPAEAFINDLFSDNKEKPLAQAGAAATIALPGRDPVSAALRQWQAQWRQLRSLNDPHGVYALLPLQIAF
jgi:protease-4